MLGTFPDAALAKCDKNTLATCIKDLVGTNFLAYPISDVPEKTRSESRKKSSRSKANRNFADTSNSTIKKPASLLRSTGYLIDLGSDDNRWMEGKGWEDLGCIAHTDGPYKRQMICRPVDYSEVQGHMNGLGKGGAKQIQSNLVSLMG